jgi:hypothetical protein
MQREFCNDWVPIAYAAEILGVSLDTVRRQIKRGTLPARKATTPQGYKWEVYLATGFPRTDLSTGHSSTTTAELAHRLSDLTDQTMEIVAQMASIRGQMEWLRDRVAQLEGVRTRRRSARSG